MIEDTCHTAEVYDPSSILLQAYSCYRDASLLSRFLAGKAAIVKTLLRHNDNKGHPASTDHREYLEHINHRISDLALGLAESERVLFQAESTLLRRSAIHSARTRTQLAAVAAALILLSVVLCYMHYDDARQPPAHL
jgi:Mg2+ and Co2+ transporter CorA